ncbi:hypothetical protein HF313_18525 [Massilia atriviolacea]|uniref:SMI1/KNR4 family protein n=1 Tax=Massilia atriviolacea TaxID=2495579 RepID=A0A430HT70_9BURK|nr:SMI1/KNR4 family protein [Massilia atriviolacea]RSZ60721.1 hypothetical protein EJB06_00860 [Massilia atriviolacea]
MSLLRRLLDLLTPYVDDAAPVAESAIRQFADGHGIVLRDDHVQCLTRFGGGKQGRLRIFRWYEGDFDFELLKSVYLDGHPDMALPAGTSYFGSSLTGDAFCLDLNSGKIFAYDEGIKYGKVHESIDGFLFRCLVSVYAEQAFAGKAVERGLAPESLAAFRSAHAQHRMDEASCFMVRYDDNGSPAILAEYYFIDRQLIALYPDSNSRVTHSGGVLGALPS